MGESYWKQNVTDQIFFCTCWGEGVVVRHDEEFIFLSLWGYADNISLKWRIKQAWDALRGRSCAEVVLNSAITSSLIQRLQKGCDALDAESHTIEEMCGLVPDMTEGLSLKDYMSELRD